MKEEHRDKLITWLVDDDFDKIEGLPHDAWCWLELVFLDGFKGYRNMTDEELEAEYKERSGDEDPLNLKGGKE